MDSAVFAPAEVQSRPGKWPLREDVFAHAGEITPGQSRDVARESVLAGQEISDLEAEVHRLGANEPELEDYSPLPEDHEVPANPAETWDRETWDHEGPADELLAGGAHAGVLCVPRVPLLASHRGSQPDLILRWNVSSAPEVIDVVVHLHGFWYAGMKLDRDIEPVSGLGLAPVGGATGQGRSRPTLTVLPRGHDTGVKQKYGPYNVFTFPALITRRGLTDLVRFSLDCFAAHVGGAAPRLGRLIFTAHSGGGAALLQMLHHNPHQVHVFDALYQDAEKLANWACERIQHDRAELQALGGLSPREYMSTRGGALRVFYQDRVKAGTRPHSLRLREDISSRLTRELVPWYRVEASKYDHFQIPCCYGWRVLADASADVPGAYTEPETRRGLAPRTATSTPRSSTSLAEPELWAEEIAGEDLAEAETPELVAMEAQSAAFEMEGLDHERPLSEAGKAGDEDELGAATPAHEALSAAFEAADLALQRSSWEISETEDEEEEEEVESGEVEIGEAEAFLESLYSREPVFGEATDATVTFPSGAALRVVPGPTGEGQEHYDPCATGNPLLDTSEPVRSTLLSPSFTVGELARSGGKTFHMARIDPELVRCLQQLHDYVGKPVHVTSGYRPYAYNEELYRQTYKKDPTKSRHSSGQAADVRIAGMSGMEIAKAAIDAYGPNIGVGIAGTWAHLDVRGKWAKWTYFGKDTDRERLAIAEIDTYRRQRLGRPAASVPQAGAPSRETSARILDALGRGLWDTAVRIAIGAGVTDVNRLTNMLFYLRNPHLRGIQIGPEQHDLGRQWTEIRDRWVRPALISTPAPRSTPRVASRATGSAQAAAESSTPATATPAFTREHYLMSDREVLVVRAGAGRREIRRRVSDIVAEVLRLAGQDPVAWYNDFTSGVTFLGRLIRDPIHVHLAEHLRDVGRTLAARHGGANADPAAAGIALGLGEDIIGSRHSPTSATVSMHMFGLAIDVNYTANPFISTSANPVFARAGQLINRRPAAWRSGMTYAQLTDLNQTLTSYFALLDHTAALQTRLESATAGPWRGKTAAQAQAQIQADLNDLAERWKRNDDPRQLGAVRTTGFTNLKQSLVNGIGLSWGAAYGDMMHFDMRNDGGIGQRIQAAIVQWKAGQEAKARRPAAISPATP